ncbi:hypothetical protein BU17DRAFT_55015 [Hysterangium stoloniferum]|nr:hypothetical protein BU17DRAFT_55015 [Hysterangium stoloniferum]
MGGFVQPVFDDSLVVPQWIQFNGQNSPNHPVFVYSSLQDTAIQTITWSEFAQAVNVAANLVRARIGEDTMARSPVIAILANLDTITYHTLLWGIITAGGTAFPISTRNSPTIVLDLVRKTMSEGLFVDLDAPSNKVTSSALQYHTVLLQIPSFSDLYFYEGDTPTHINAWSQTKIEEILDTSAVVLHSSGTTSLPSPIHVSHRTLLQWSRNTNIGGADMSKHRIAVHGLPVFHAMGYFVISWAARTGMSVAVFPPCDPPIAPSYANLLEAAIACQSTVMFSVPIFIEIWSRNAEDVERLRKLNGIMFGGGPLEKTVGDTLSRNGVTLVGLYGTTEAGPVGQINLEPTGYDEWDWLTINPQCDPRFIPQDDIPDVFELVFVESSTHSPASFNFTLDGKRAFATKDLVLRHPNNPAKFKVYGRKDDQIILSTGEKCTDFIPLETIICRNPLVEIAMVIGHGKSHIGVLVQPTRGHQVPLQDVVALENYRNAIWPSVEEANALSPSHSKIFKEMIIVSHPERPLEVTTKLTPRRSVILTTYKNEISAAYIAASISKYSICVPSTWSPHQIIILVRSVVHAVMARSTPINDDDDIFENGGDSLQAAYIRNTLIQTIVQEKQMISAPMPQDIVYSNPTVTTLTNATISLMNSTISRPNIPKLSNVDGVQRIITNLTSTFPTHQPSPRLVSTKSRVIVLLTGTTGALGSQLLANLVSSLEVNHIYALNRKSDARISLHRRQADALSRRGLPPAVVESDKVTLLEGDTTLEELGLGRHIFEEIRDNVTLIIHTAWKVNFNLGLNSYIPLLQGVRKLVDIALQSPLSAPPRFIFSSSVGVYKSEMNERPKEEPIKDFNIVAGSGYSESKWIAERILEEAAKRTALKPIIVRIGQMTSNSSGAWNSTDWLPAMLRSGQLIGALPFRDDSIAWVSTEIVARAMFEFRTSHSQYLHLVHPNPVPWMSVFSIFSEKLHIPLIPWDEWVKRLDNGRIDENPALHLLGFFQQATPLPIENKESLGIPYLDLTEALLASSTLSDKSLPQISGRDAVAWITHWRDIGFLTRGS